MSISPLSQPDIEPRQPEFLRFALPITTTDSLPGMTSVVGVVVGVATRPRDQAHNPELPYINTRARQDALGMMVLQAQEAGADAVVAVRFDSGKISESVTEITAYGTAVKLQQPDWV